MSVHHFHTDQNVPCLSPPPPPQKKHNHCFQFLPGSRPREMEDNGYANFLSCFFLFFGGGGEGGRGWAQYSEVYVKMVNKWV